MPMQSSPDGNAIAYEANPFFEGLASGPNEYIANRGEGGWASTPLSTPFFGDRNEQGFMALSTDLNRGVLYQESPVLSPDAPPGYPNLYLWQAGGALKPLITSEPPNRSPDQFRALTYAGANAGTPSALGLQPPRLPGQRRADHRSAGDRPRSAAGGRNGKRKRPLRMV